MTIYTSLFILVVGITCAASTWPVHPTDCWSKESGHGGDDCLHRNNPNPGVVPKIKTYTNPPVFVKQVKNGKLYTGGSGEDTFHIVHLWSSSDTTDNFYEMGEAYGQLLAVEFATMFDNIEGWLVEMLEGATDWLPDWIAKLLVDEGAGPVLDLLLDIVYKHIPKRYYEEWEGIVAGCKSVGGNCTINDVARVSLFAQISKAACTAFAAHDKATVGGAPMHLRCLDFNATSYVAKYSALTIYHYNTMPQYANFGYTAMTDCLTCSNSLLLSIGEKKWGGHNTLIPSGLPWQMMMRESMEYTKITDVKKFIQSKSVAPPDDDPYWPGGDINTVSIHVVIADGTSNGIAAAEIGYNYSKWFDWNTDAPTKTHPNYEDLVYWPKNSNPNTMCPADMITSQYGSIDADWMANYYAYGDMTGDTQIVAWDHQQNVAYYANSRKTPNGSGPLCAYFRDRTRLDMKALYAEKRP